MVGVCDGNWYILRTRDSLYAVPLLIRLLYLVRLPQSSAHFILQDIYLGHCSLRTESSLLDLESAHSRKPELIPSSSGAQECGLHLYRPANPAIGIPTW